MFLNQTSQYALRAMAGLIVADQSVPVNSKELAKTTEIPSHYLSKIMRKMVEAEFVESRKGHGGGFVMRKPLKDIRIIDVLEAAGFNMEEQPCVFGWDECSDYDPCPLHPVWKRLKDSFKDWAYNTTLEDVQRENSLLENGRFQQMKKSMD
jgi:Rrf2 family transcriptional regulator, iron-sulfur cluster assembly transcription factor